MAATIPTTARRIRNRTGARNRHRDGRSAYSKKAKGSKADRYGEWNNGRRIRPEIIAGHVLDPHDRPGES